MNHNYYHQANHADQHRANLLREAETQRLSQEVEQPGLTTRLMTNVGDWMITEGTRLKNRTAEVQGTERSLLAINRYS